MKPLLRVIITAAALLGAMLLAGFLSMAYGNGPRGGPYGIMMALIASIPFIAWWLTGRRTPRR